MSARGKLELEFCILRCGGTAFNILMIKREIVWSSVVLSCVNRSCFGEGWPVPNFVPNCALVLIPQRQEGRKTTGSGISELSLSQRSWKPKRRGWGRTERVEDGEGAGTQYRAL